MRLREVSHSVREAEKRFHCGALLNVTEIGVRYRGRKMSWDTSSLIVKKRAAKKEFTVRFVSNVLKKDLNFFLE